MSRILSAAGVLSGRSRRICIIPGAHLGGPVRGKPEKFAEHYQQATLFWESQSVPEQQHIIRAFRFELSKVQVPAIGNE